jgi:hypothetical protein
MKPHQKADPLEHELDYDTLFRKRVIEAQRKKTTLETLSPKARLLRNLELANDNLGRLHFNCTLFNRYLAEILAQSEGCLLLKHPKGEHEILMLVEEDNTLRLKAPHLTECTDDDPPHFHDTLKLARWLQTPTTTFDYFIEMFGAPNIV